MTLLDLCCLIRKRIALIIALPIVCGLACFGYFAVFHSDGETFTAQSRIVVSTHVQEVAGLAQAQGRAYTDKDENISVTAAGDGGNKTVTITAVTTDESLSLELANMVADAVLDEAFDFVPENYEDPFNARVELADEATKSASLIKLKYVIASVFGGLFLAICIIVIIDLKKRPIKSVEGIQDAVKLPVIEVMPVSDNGERLLANIRFASQMDNPRTICVIPVGEIAAAEQVTEVLLNAAKTEDLGTNLNVKLNQSLSDGMKAAYEARSADATILVATQWNDSMTALDCSVSELRLAGANLVGVVFARLQG